MTDEFITCPRCGKRDTESGFDIAGGCPGCVFCTDCHCEIDISKHPYAAHICSEFKSECVKTHRWLVGENWRENLMITRLGQMKGTK